MIAEEARLWYAYNHWANARVLEASRPLSPEQLHRNLETSHRSVFGTLVHTLWGEWRWLGRWRGSPPRGADPLSCTDLTSLRERWSAVRRDQEEFLKALTDDALNRLISYENPPGRRWTYSLAHMLQHVVNHSTYHRGQVVALLRQLAATPTATDFLVFIDEQGERSRE